MLPTAEERVAPLLSHKSSDGGGLMAGIFIGKLKNRVETHRAIMEGHARLTVTAYAS